MCGLGGFVDPELTIAEPRAALAAMTRALAHRGPDGSGEWHDGFVHLGHRRLAIVETGAAGAQPMVGPSGAVIAFNGEIYNHPELRTELEAAGFSFRTRSDTEVLLAAWAHWGPACLDRLLGMFAFALWDGRQLVLARDRLGKKPLHLAHDGRFLAFASEIEALLALEPVGRAAALDPFALADFLTLGYVAGPRTIHANIRRLPPAHWAAFDPGSGALQIQEYWRLEDYVLAPRRRYDAATREEFAALLEDAVRLRLRADVPVGCFLSGGLDSSTVAALAARVATTPPRAFCVGFAQASFDESGHARAVADHLGLDLAVLEAQPPDLAAVIRHCDGPFADTSLLPTWQLNQAAARHVKVALSGDGADEILAGYPTYRADRLYRLYRHVPAGVQRGLERTAHAVLRPSYRKVSLDYKLRQFLSGRGLSPERAHAWWRVVFPPAQWREMLADGMLARIGDYDPLATFDHHFDRVKGADFLDRALYVDVKTWLADDILVKADRMSMAHGIEVRSPFLDHRLVELAFRLEPAAKMDARRQKVALRDAARGLLPAATLGRRKQGFGAPARKAGTEVPPALDFPTLFRQGFALDGAREDVTYKAFALGILTAWLRHRHSRNPELTP